MDKACSHSLYFLRRHRLFRCADRTRPARIPQHSCGSILHVSKNLYHLHAQRTQHTFDRGTFQHNWSFSPQSQTQHQALQACSLGSTAPGSWLSPKPPTLLVQTPDSANLVDHRHHLASGQALEACAAIVRDTSASRVESLGAGKTPRVMRHLVLSSGENIKCGEAVHFQHLLR